LESLPKAECERLRWGNWFARPTGSTFFSRHDVIELDTPPPRSEFVRVVRSYDFAGVLPNDNNRSPDYTASVKMGKLKTGDYVILEVTRTRMKFGTWMEHIYENAQRDGSNVEILLPEDPNPMAKASTVRMCRELTESGYAATYKRSGQGKLDSFRPFAASVQIGVVSVVKNCATDLWNKIYSDNSFFYNELEAFDGERRGGENGHDDMVDCCSSAYSYLASRFHIPNFLPGLKSADLSFNNPFAQ
jgi:predicted phage terminase large subunit-like protein